MEISQKMLSFTSQVTNWTINNDLGREGKVLACIRVSVKTGASPLCALRSEHFSGGRRAYSSTLEIKKVDLG